MTADGMRGSWWWGLSLWGACAVGVASTALVSRSASSTRLATVLPVHGELPSFSVVDQAGRYLTRETLKGDVWIADFIFTRCAGQCPLLSARMAALQASLRSVPRVRLVSFSVDPQHDTPAVLAAYAARVGAQVDRWVFVTGEPASMRALVQEGFRLAAAEGRSAREPIAHSVKLVLVDSRGRIRGYYDAMAEHTLTRLEGDVRTLLNESASSP